MAIKPILFNTEMVRAILDGRKSCTRRLVKTRRKDACGFYVTRKTDGTFAGIYEYDESEIMFDNPLEPLYQPGDILYVRETVWQKIGHYLDIDGETRHGITSLSTLHQTKSQKRGGIIVWAKRPSIHMPKEAARIWLKVTDVRVERLQEITEAGAEAEGAVNNIGMIHAPDNEYDHIHTAKEHFIEIWNSTIKKSDIDRYGWDANPYVWVIEFERCEKPEGV